MELLAAIALPVAILVSVIVYRRAPFLSAPWRIKLFPYESDYHGKPGVEISLVKRLSSGGMSFDRKTFKKVEYGDRFDDELSEALVEARSYLKTVIETERVLGRLNRR